jgi:hypothetical protein
MLKGLMTAGLAMALVAYAVPASATTITFETDTAGAKADGFVSNDSPLVAFSDTVGAELDLNNYGAQGSGTLSLAVNSDGDGGGLLMIFAAGATALQLDFGNDDPAWTAAGDLAVLTLFVGAVQVGQTTVVMNRDDIMNQTIGLSGIFFDRATFFYTDENLVPFTGPGATGNIGLIEIVDNIQFTAVPEPATLLLLGSGLGLAAARRRMKKRA